MLPGQGMAITLGGVGIDVAVAFGLTNHPTLSTGTRRLLVCETERPRRSQ
jgi:hypothetical protein